MDIVYCRNWVVSFDNHGIVFEETKAEWLSFHGFTDRLDDWMENWSCATSDKTSSRRTSTSTRAWAGQGSVGRGSVGRGQGCVSRGMRSGTYRPDCEPAPVEDGGQGRRMYHACLRHPTTTPGVGVGVGVGGATYEHFLFSVLLFLYARPRLSRKPPRIKAGPRFLRDYGCAEQTREKDPGNVRRIIEYPR